MQVQTWQFKDFTCSTDKQKLQIPLIHDFLCNRSYWAKGRSIEQVTRSIEFSECFGIYEDDLQVGFARIASDYTVFAYIMDVFILESKRGQGLGKFLMQCITNHPELQDLRKWMLGTDDAHELYKQFNFMSLVKPENHMEMYPTGK